MPRIIAADRLNDHYIAYDIEAPEIVSTIEPGQLLEARLGEQPRVTPHAIADFDRDKGTVTIVTRSAGGSETKDDPAGATIDLSGPFGQHRSLKGVGKILCVAEGLGVAGLYTRLTELKANDAYTIVVVGFQSKEYVFWINRLDSISNELYVITDDGSYGIKGPIKDTIKGVCENELDIDRALAIGSLKLLKTCCAVTSAHGIPTMISLNAVPVEDVETPRPDGARVVSAFDWTTLSDLDGHKVDFDELTQKLGIQIAR